jgi:nucleotide-binding universal stress UspA family protein
VIVAGIDGSQHSLAAAAEAADLVERMDGWLVLVHARRDPVPPGAIPPSANDPLAKLEKSAARQLARLTAAELGTNGGPARLRPVFGDPVRPWTQRRPRRARR